MTNDLKSHSLRSAKWSILLSILQKVFIPVANIIIARHISPEIFGELTIILLFVTFSDLIREEAFSKAYIRLGDDKTFFTFFSINILIGIFLYMLLTKTPLNDFIINTYNVDKNVFDTISIYLILTSASSTLYSRLFQNMDFKTIFRVELIPSLTPYFITLPLAMFGYGLWSFVIGYLVAGTIKLIGLILANKNLTFIYRFDLQKAKTAIAFSWYIFIEAVLGWIYVWGDKLIGSTYMDIKQLGLYSLSSMIVTSVFSFIYYPINQISYPALCKISDQEIHFKSMVYTLLRLAVFIAFPTALILFSIAQFANLILGNKWNGTMPLVTLLTITSLLAYIVTIIIPNALKAKHLAHIMPTVQFYKLFYTLPLWTYGVIAYGVIGLCVSKIISVSIGFVIFLYIGIKHLNLDTQHIAFLNKHTILSGVISLSIYFYTISFISHDNIVMRLTVLLISLIIYISYHLFFNRKYILELKAVIKQIR